MENAGVVGGNEVFKDVETGSRWQQSSLEAISGPMKGEHLELYPFLLTSWDEWLRLHPDTLVLKLYSVAWLPHLEALSSAIARTLTPERVVLRLARAIAGAALEDGAILRGPPLREPIVFRENGLRFRCDPVHGQKTGFFLDQRENRARVGERARGRRVLNAFSYTGGFSLYAARGGATSVLSLDASRPALDEAERNFRLNTDVPGVASAEHERVCEDAFAALARFARERRRFELVVIDPPAFAKARRSWPSLR